MSDSPLETETTGDGTTTFEHFGREWTIPTKRHLSHIKAMRDAMRSGVGSVDLMIAETFLSPEQFLDLLDVDPDEDALDEFTSVIASKMGLGTSGNS
jgi:hypothetical protein